MEEFRFNLENKVQIKEQENSTIVQQLDAQTFEYKNKEQDLLNQISQLSLNHDNEVKKLNNENEELARKLENVQGELKLSKEEVYCLKVKRRNHYMSLIIFFLKKN